MIIYTACERKIQLTILGDEVHILILRGVTFTSRGIFSILLLMEKHPEWRITSSHIQEEDYQSVSIVEMFKNKFSGGRGGERDGGVDYSDGAESSMCSMQDQD